MGTMNCGTCLNLCFDNIGRAYCFTATFINDKNKFVMSPTQTEYPMSSYTFSPYFFVNRCSFDLFLLNKWCKQIEAFEMVLEYVYLKIPKNRIRVNSLSEVINDKSLSVREFEFYQMTH